jgi:nucleoside-diphosphate-sugar epimerase
MNEDRSFNYDRASADFGFRPVSFEDGVGEQIHEYIKSKRLRA